VRFKVVKKHKKKTSSRGSDAPDIEAPLVALEGEVVPPPAVEGIDPDTSEVIEPEIVVDGPEFDELEPDDVIDDTQSEDARAAGSKGAVVPYNPLDAYLAEIRRFAPLSREEEHQAAVEYHRNKSPEAAYKLVSGNLWLAVKIARDYERVARSVLDLIQEGNIGLMEAVRNFDPYRGVRFPSYAVWWIRAYIIRYIIANWRLVKIGTTQAQRKLFFNLKKESDRLEREGIFPSPKLLAERLNVREGDVIEMSQRLGGSDVSIDAPLQEDSDSNLLSVLPSDRESVEDVMAKKEFHRVLETSVSEFETALSQKEQMIFRGRILDEDKVTLQELSDKLSLSKERVRQIENKLRDKLRAFVSKKLGSELENWIDVNSEG
jgi:RNA polymerase sigma-32 factor